MDLIWARLKNGVALPPSQVVRTTPRGGTPGAAQAITAINVPKISAAPVAGNAITAAGGAVSVPQ
jgi:hydroxybutyrate-dimer hydrolase